jgi:tRNA(Ile)-lysidine synthase
MDLQQRIWDFIDSRHLLRPGAAVVVAVSGGPDSLCLLHVLHSRAAERNLSLHVAHLDHGLRPEAAAEADFVRQQAEALGLACHLGTADTHAHAAAHRQSTEEAARAVRYAFLTGVAHQVAAEHLAVAHTADDQAETVLMHFLRGAGLAGLKGMLPVTVVVAGSWKQEAGEAASSFEPPASSLSLVRPLLGATRAEVEAYCAAYGLQPRRDASNTDTRFLRNRLRHELLPLLEQYNPRLREVLARSAEVLAGEHALVQAHVQALWAALAREAPGGRVVFDRARWLALSVPEQRALLRAGVQQLRRHLRDVDFTPLEAAVRFSRQAPPGRSCDVLAGLQLSVTAETVSLQPWHTPAEVPNHAGPLLDAGANLAGGWRFGVELVEREKWAPGQPLPEAETPWCVYVDAGRLRQSVCVRARLPGERFQPLGLGGHSTKLSDFMVNQKVSAALRDQWPLVVSGDDVVWVAGLRLDERYRVRADTQRIVRLAFRQRAA